MQCLFSWWHQHPSIVSNRMEWGSWKSSPHNLKPRATSWNDFRAMGHVGLTAHKGLLFFSCLTAIFGLCVPAGEEAAGQISLHRPAEAALGSSPQWVLGQDKSLLVFSGSFAWLKTIPSGSQGDAEQRERPAPSFTVGYNGCNSHVCILLTLVRDVS